MLTTIGYQSQSMHADTAAAGVQLRQSSRICRLAVHARLAIVRRVGACQAGADSSVRVAGNI